MRCIKPLGLLAGQFTDKDRSAQGFNEIFFE
jgi:hypothetical protein